ncbi:GspE/PulE family protein [Thiohalomonas denitrificans]|uniref:GspE/PulE family protein n=1 Tax=Thiohalomonas denitrificans TaxID=415747 RepID=UPI0026F16F80|nr:GspE/PulE family protein [Thiohalomonas denitrificans]
MKARYKSAALHHLGKDGMISARKLAELEQMDETGFALALTEAQADEVGHWLSEQFYFEYLPPDDLVVDDEVKELASGDIAGDINAIPIRIQDERLVTAIYDPFDDTLREQLEAYFRRPVNLCLTTPHALHRLRERHGSGDEKLRRASRGLGGYSTEALEDVEGANIDEASAPVVRLVNTVLREGVYRNASDVHIEAQPEGTVIRFRIDGVLTRLMEPVAAHFHGPIVSRIKVVASLDIAEHRLPQDGRFTMEIDDSEIDFRVSILPGAVKEAVVVRILDHRAVPGGLDCLRLEKLGFDAQVSSRVRAAMKMPHGLVLVTGPTGSGKTTTLYSGIGEFNLNTEKLITIEDPVEYQFPNVVQVAVNEKTGLTFAAGLRSILRHDPDRIMVGEIRDRETAEIAIQSALTGHLVLSTIHANSGSDVVERLRHMNVSLGSLVQALNGIVSQRLIRKLCPDCLSMQPVDPETLASFGLHSSDKEMWPVPVGCENCNQTGYRGRTAIAEFVDSVEIAERQQVVPSEDDEDPRRLRMQKAALELAKADITSLDEVRRVLGVWQ